ncbi:MAG: hypothetical protein IKT40_01540 [Bacilli bacterium]|nr:hypothetical protein [Bacilli bacterium]
MITTEAKFKNYSIFLTKLKELGIDVEPLDQNLREKLMNAPYAYSNEMGLAYDGCLLQNIVRVFTPYAIKVNESLPEDIRADKNSLLKVCLLHQISKAVTFEKNNNQWEVNNRGLVYRFAKVPGSLKTGMRSLIMCQNLGITFTEVEAEAMIVMDRDENDTQVKFYSSNLSTVLKVANELTFLQNRLEKLNETLGKTSTNE